MDIAGLNPPDYSKSDNSVLRKARKAVATVPVTVFDNGRYTSLVRKIFIFLIVFFSKPKKVMATFTATTRSHRMATKRFRLDLRDMSIDNQLI